MKKMSTRFLVFVALLTAVAVVAKMFLGIPVTIAGSYIKDINLSSVVIMLGGAVFGPLAGGIIGALTDIIVTLLRPMGAYCPLFTISNTLIGIIPALFFMKKNFDKVSIIRTFAATLTVQVICSMILNTLWQIIMGYIPFDWTLIFTRWIASIIQWPIYSLVLYFLLTVVSKLHYKFPNY